MGNRWINITICLLLAAQPALAQTLIPATSEDITEFDRQVAEQMKRSAAKKDHSNFGAQVSEEAKKLKDASADQGKDFGKWVSSQRKKNDQGRPSSEGGVGSSAGKSDDAPGLSNSNHGKGKNKNK